MSKVKTKSIFYGGVTTINKIQQERRCDLNTKLRNRYLNSNHETPLNLPRYISIFKKEVTELLKKPNYQKSNLAAEERPKLKHFSENRNLTKIGTDRGGKIVIMSTANYIKHYGLYLNDRVH